MLGHRERTTKTLVDDLLDTLNDSRFNDIVLVGEDGIEIPTNRTILAARSDFFRKKFFEQPSHDQAYASRFEFSHPSSAISVMIQFCYSDKLIGFDDYTEKNVRQMGQLFLAGRHFHVDAFNDRIEDWCACAFEKHPELAIALLDSLTGKVGSDNVIGRRATTVIRERVADVLYPSRPDSVGKGIGGIGFMALYNVLEDKRVNATELFLFKCLLDWIAIDPVNRLRNATELVDRIEATRILPEDLLTTISPAGLFAPEDLLDANNIHQVCLKRMTKDELASIISLPRAQFQGGLSITVTGAGSEEANGLYIAHGITGGVIRYYNYTYSLKPGNKDTDIEMYRPSFVEPRWVINKTVKDGKKRGSRTVLKILYETLANGSFYSVGGDSCIPKRGWYVHDKNPDSEGEEPAPKMIFRYFHHST